MNGKTAPRPYRWTVAEFHKLAEIGLFSEDDRIELIKGELIEMAPVGSEHAGYVNYLTNYFIHRLHNKAIVAGQNPIILDGHSEPQPDVALLRWRDDFYASAKPTPQDILLIIEVSDTTARYDREVKVPLYAQYAIPEVWLIDPQKKRLETYRKLVDEEYSQISHYREGRVTAELIPEATIEVVELFSIKPKAD